MGLRREDRGRCAACAMTRFGAGVSCGTALRQCAIDALAQALEPLAGQPDLVCVFVCGPDPEEAAAAARLVMERLPAAHTLGCTATGVIGSDHGIEELSAVSVFAAMLPRARLTACRLETTRAGDRLVVRGMAERHEDDAVAVLLADPYSFPADAFVEHSNQALNGLALVGGLANGLGGRDSVRLFLDGQVYADGAVALLLGGEVNVATLVSQGCRPIGPPMTVTGADGNTITELAGVSALNKLEQIVAGLSAEDRAMVEQGLQLGIAMNEYSERHERGDFLIRGVIGADPGSGAIAIGDVVEPGQTVRFQVRDAGTASADLAGVLADFPALTGVDPVEGTLLFSCNGRGRALFASADHDPALLRDRFPGCAVGGFFAAGEIGPVGGRNHMHGFTASMLVFGPMDSESWEA